MLLKKSKATCLEELPSSKIHNIVIGKELAKKGIDPVLEFVDRQPSFHINSNLFVTESGALDIIKTPTLFERFVSSILTSYIEDESTINPFVKDFLIARYNSGDSILPELVFIRPAV